MPNEQLLAHIRGEFAHGEDRTTVIRSLLTAGWRIEDINAALAVIDSGSTHTAPPTPPAPSFSGGALQSQTGSPQTPIQVENVQYGVRVGSFFSRMSLVFVIANASLVVLTLTAAWFLRGFLVIEEGTDAMQRLVVLISLAVPLLPLFLFTNNRLNKLMGDPALREDILFKKRLRNVLWTEVTLAAVLIAVGIYQGLSVTVLGKSGSAVDGFTSALFYGGAFALLALWAYSFQKKTAR